MRDEYRRAILFLAMCVTAEIAGYAYGITYRRGNWTFPC